MLTTIPERRLKLPVEIEYVNDELIIMIIAQTRAELDARNRTRWPVAV